MADPFKLILKLTTKDTKAISTNPKITQKNKNQRFLKTEVFFFRFNHKL
jgi:transcriptional antiterminator Rof (Rho-off)